MREWMRLYGGVIGRVYGNSRYASATGDFRALILMIPMAIMRLIFMITAVNSIKP